MKKNSLLDIYNTQYAASYNEKFLTNPFSRISSDYELQVLKGLMKADTKWLDAGCGTGYYLGCFPGIQRAGLDISPDMLAEAKKASPDALLFREGDFRVDIPEWHQQWSLISCMWYPYSYLDSINEFETMLMHLVNWLKTGGDIFLPVADLYDLRSSAPPIPYALYDDVYAGTTIITSYTWTWIQDNNEGTHINMVAPHVEHVIQLLQPYFETIEVLRYAPAYEGWVSRRAIVARGKRSERSEGAEAAHIIRHEVPAAINATPQIMVTDHVPAGNPLAVASHKQLFGELFGRIRSGRLFKSVVKKVLGRN